MKSFRILVIRVSIWDLGYQSDLHGYDKIPGKSPKMEGFIESHYFKKFLAEERATVHQNGIGRAWLFACLMATMKENETGRKPIQYTTYKGKVPVGLLYSTMLPVPQMPTYYKTIKKIWSQRMIG